MLLTLTGLSTWKTSRPRKSAGGAFGTECHFVEVRSTAPRRNTTASVSLILSE